MAGTNVEAILAVRRDPTTRLTAAGGITTRERSTISTPSESTPWWGALYRKARRRP